MPTESTSTASRQSIARREFITAGALVIAGVTARSSVALAESNPENFEQRGSHPPEADLCRYSKPRLCGAHS